VRSCCPHGAVMLPTVDGLERGHCGEFDFSRIRAELRAERAMALLPDGALG